MKLLFICTGNTCRSSMAEGMMKRMLYERNVNDVYPSSAGISAINGQSANIEAIKVMSDIGIDISKHKSRQVTDEMIQESDLILTMSSTHKKILCDYFKKDANKIFTVKEYSNELGDLEIEDPYGMSYDVYKQCANEISVELNKIIKKLKKE